MTEYLDKFYTEILYPNFFFVLKSTVTKFGSIVFAPSVIYALQLQFICHYKRPYYVTKYEGHLRSVKVVRPLNRVNPKIYHIISTFISRFVFLLKFRYFPSTVAKSITQSSRTQRCDVLHANNVTEKFSQYVLKCN